jgi:DNA adenine methylase
MESVENTKSPRPFLKWVGGKKQLLKELIANTPKEYNAYYEPFIGGGALFFELKHKPSHINDINTTLTGAYKNIKENLPKVLTELRKLDKAFRAKGEEEQKEMFYEIRTAFNSMSSDKYLKTAYLIFLNKTSYNGMYRENSKGEFNTPFGRYKNPLICDEPNLKLVSDLLQEATITNTSFENAVKEAKKNDLVYFDPPYHPVNETANFTSYSGDGFNKEDQIKLKETMDKLTKKGVKVMLSNSFTPFIIDLYKDYKQVTVYANRAINCKAKGRGKVKELLIVNY